MTPLEDRILEQLRARPDGAKVHELAEALRIDGRGVEAGLRMLERAGLVERYEDLAHIITWTAIELPEAA